MLNNNIILISKLLYQSISIGKNVINAPIDVIRFKNDT